MAERVLSGGAAAIRSAGDSALDVDVTGGGTIASLTENAPAVLLDGVRRARRRP